MSNQSKRTRNAKRKALRLDRIIAGVGRIQRSSGTRDRRLYRELNKMIDQFRDYGRIDILAGIRDGQWTPLHAYRLYRAAGANPAAMRLARQT